MNNNYTIEPRRGIWHDFFVAIREKSVKMEKERYKKGKMYKAGFCFSL